VITNVESCNYVLFDLHNGHEARHNLMNIHYEARTWQAVVSPARMSLKSNESRPNTPRSSLFFSFRTTLSAHCRTMTKQNMS
jgi:hypothetical protein